MFNSIIRDSSLSAIAAGFIAVLVGFASAMAIVFQAAVSSGANSQQIESWVWALGLGMGLSSLGLSLWYKRPLIIAWSTPGAALLATGTADADLATATGTFLTVGVLITLVGVTGVFNRLVRLIPLSIASAMLAGILVQFGLSLFGAMQTQPFLIISMILIYLIAKRLVPRYAIPLVLSCGVTFCLFNQTIQTQNLSLALASPEWVTPTFSWSSIIGIGLPLFIVTMTSQNLPGVAILKSSGYQDQPISPVITTTGVTTLLFAPFGGFTFNLAAITAAICTSDESHPNPEKRYIAGVSVGVFNILAGVFGTAVVSLFAAFPQALIAGLAGLALLTTIGASLKAALNIDSEKEAAMLTFLMTASGISFFGIASAFWGVIIGMTAMYLSKRV
ncbi:benzoate/H(+) symporter BenE family transporter [Aliiglaciecola lipolytica]|uniref:Benzoate membrane transport protein n=1 Tax=Aliiglaciecola lipolytica E3 TaxID=1127673 RepID=K6YST7_9ALTE|nr:benzoate/H(+) symporter BenE family transporter [Aliiglaciecola lipolytica]GAC14340.1 benzoate membrane transport protein [Aliiglaciecola lipolytica E3]